MIKVAICDDDNLIAHQLDAYSAKTEHSLRMSGALFR